MRENALAWLDGDAAFPREKALGEQHMAIDVLDLLDENAKLRARLAEVERERDEARANPSTEGCAICETDHRRVLIDKLRAECEAMRVERDKWVARAASDETEIAHLTEERNAWKAAAARAGTERRSDEMQAIHRADALAAEVERLKADAHRYQRLRVLGCAPSTSKQLQQATVLCFTNLDAFVDEDLATRPSRGEPIAAAAGKESK